MTRLDYGRENDLEELTEALKNASSQFERDYYKKIMYRILNESEAIRYLREELIKAVRDGKNSAIEKIHMRIQQVRLRETNGRSWGANKQNRVTN